MKKKTCVVIPCYKVRHRISKVLTNKYLSKIDKIILVDDKCPQNTGLFLKKKFKSNKYKILINRKNLGVGGATIIGFKLYDILPTDIVSIPVFIMPLYITILMLRAVELYYRIAVVSGGIIGPILYPYIGDWSIIIGGLVGGTLGLLINHLIQKGKSDA